jgi:uncharacterized protein (DUF983 family)
MDDRNRGGPVNSDVSYFRDTPGVIHVRVDTGVTCHRCGSGEVYTPMQTADLPTIRACLRCGERAATTEFDQT